MNKQNLTRNILKNGGAFFLIVLLTGYLLLRENSISRLAATISQANPFYVLVAAGCMCIFVGCEAANIRRTLGVLGYKKTRRSCIKYALVGFFFSSVTPSASGGQPMQIYYMHKDEIDISHSSLALLMELASYQLVAVTIAAAGFALKFELFSQSMGKMKYLFFAGLAVNAFILALLLLAIFSKNIIGRIVGLAERVLEKFRYKKTADFKIKAAVEVEKYRSGAVYLKNNKLVLAKVVLTTTFQIIALHSVSFWVYRAFGLWEQSFVTVVAMQAMLYMAVAALPLPGGAGVSEGGFLLLFKTLFPAGILSSAMLLCRGISFYLFLVISGMAVLSGLRKVHKFEDYSLNL